MTARLSRTAFAILLAASVGMVGCRGDDGAEIGRDTTMVDTMMQDMTGMGMMNRAVAQLSPTQGNNVSGTVTLTSENGGVRVEANVTRLSAGKHGFHIYQNGDCSAPDAGTAGEHFAMQGQQHGGPEDDQRHTGDLGNIEAGSDGSATYSQVIRDLSLRGPNGIVGKAVIVHELEDDLTTQPDGNSGARLACGVIQAEGGMGRMPGQGPGPGPGAIGSDTTAQPTR